jgi:hypothetical protein
MTFCALQRQAMDGNTLQGAFSPLMTVNHYPLLEKVSAGHQPCARSALQTAINVQPATTTQAGNTQQNTPCTFQIHNPMQE